MSHAADDCKAVLFRLIEMFRTGDTASVDEIVANTYHDHQGLRGIEIRGATGFAEVVDAARSAFVTLDVGAEDLIAEGDRGVARIRWHGVCSTREVVDRETIDIVRVSNGRAVEHWGAEAWSRSTPPSN